MRERAPAYAGVRARAGGVWTGCSSHLMIPISILSHAEFAI